MAREGLRVGDRGVAHRRHRARIHERQARERIQRETEDRLQVAGGGGKAGECQFAQRGARVVPRGPSSGEPRFERLAAFGPLRSAVERRGDGDCRPWPFGLDAASRPLDVVDHRQRSARIAEHGEAVADDDRRDGQSQPVGAGAREHLLCALHPLTERPGRRKQCGCDRGSAWVDGDSREHRMRVIGPAEAPLQIGGPGEQVGRHPLAAARLRFDRREAVLGLLEPPNGS